MYYSDKYFYKKVEFDMIIDKLIQESILIETKNYFEKMTPMNNIDDICDELDKVDEARIIISHFNRAPIYITTSYSSLLDITLKGGIISSKEIYQTIYLFTSIKANLRILSSCVKDHLQTKHYEALLNSCILKDEIEKLISRSIDDNGYVLDDASMELKKIRNKMKGIDERIHHRLSELLITNSKYLSESMVVLRDDRYCLCIKAEYKNSFNGILHDTSSSNLTCYMEPISVAEMANEKEHLKLQEKAEIDKIISLICSVLQKNDEILRKNYELLIELDIMFAKAMVGISYNGEKPSINNKGILNLKNAVHPLLKVKHVIPNNVMLGNKYYGIVITGPNTGGKTVLLKTVGLLCTMVKFGLLIPADGSSNVMIYDHIFCDIGDDQSIQENLSTFSSHMQKLVTIVNMVTPHSLVLLDEIGSGTDPMEGSSIAVATLKYFLEHKVNFITTTHYAELKTFAYTENKIINASMQFNDDTLQPTYHLLIGKSGSSNALQIAKNLGLKDEIINNAQDYFKKDSSKIQSNIEKIEMLSAKILKEEKIVQDTLEELKVKEKELNDKIATLEKDKEKILSDERAKAIKQSKKQMVKINDILLELEKLKDSGIKMHEILAAKELVKEIDSFALEEPVKKKPSKVKNHEFKLYDSVYVAEYDQYGTIMRIRKNRTFDVQMGNLMMNMTKEDLEYCEQPLENKQKYDNVDVITSTNNKSVKLSLDLRGMRYEEARDALDKYVDDLLVSHLTTATIIHGFGTGTIRELVLDYCKKCPFISSYRFGGEKEGGLGVTIITLKAND